LVYINDNLNENKNAYINLNDRSDLTPVHWFSLILSWSEGINNAKYSLSSSQGQKTLIIPQELTWFSKYLNRFFWQQILITINTKIPNWVLIKNSRF
jgi:hypothetical protein